jgi:hypothetical protein
MEKRTLYVINDGNHWLVEENNGVNHAACDTLSEAIACAAETVKLGLADEFVIDE